MKAVMVNTRISQTIKNEKTLAPKALSRFTAKAMYVSNAKNTMGSGDLMNFEYELSGVDGAVIGCGLKGSCGLPCINLKTSIMSGSCVPKTGIADGS